MGYTDQSVQKLYGVGAVKAAAYAKQGIYTIGDILYNFPRAIRKSVGKHRDRISGWLSHRAAGYEEKQEKMTTRTNFALKTLYKRVKILYNKM